MADAVVDLRGLECIQDLQQCRLITRQKRG